MDQPGRSSVRDRLRKPSVSWVVSARAGRRQSIPRWELVSCRYFCDEIDTFVAISFLDIQQTTPTSSASLQVFTSKFIHDKKTTWPEYLRIMESCFCCCCLLFLGLGLLFWTCFFLKQFHAVKLFCTVVSLLKNLFNCGLAMNCQLVLGVTHDPDFSRKMVLKMEG